MDDLVEKIYNGADVIISLDCGNYTEILPINSVCIKNGKISGLVDYHTSLPFQNSPYNAILNYEFGGNFVILRIPDISGKCDIEKDIPNIGFHKNGHYRKHQWVAKDLWHASTISINEIIKIGNNVKIKIKYEDTIIFVYPSIIIQYLDERISIRSRVVAIPYSDHIDLIDFNITNNKLECKILRFWKPPLKFSTNWFMKHIKKLLGFAIFETDYVEFTKESFSYEVLVLTPDYDLSRYVY